MPTPSLILVPARFKTGKLYTPLATTSGGVVLGASGDFNVTRNTTATRVNANGLIESVASGIPRLDYYTSGGTAGCPALLVEPSAINSLLQSAAWNVSPWAATSGSQGATVSGNVTASPDGTTNADKLIEAAVTGNHFCLQSLTLTSGTTYTASFFVKASERSRGRLRTSGSGVYFDMDFNLTSGTVTGGTNPFIQNFGNGWYRIGATFTANQASNNFILFLYDASGNVSYTGDGTSGLFVFGAQIEVGSIATSYIPTTAAAVTRNADVISLLGAVSGCIGQTAGTLYAEFEIRSDTTTRRLFALSDGTQSNRVFLYYTSNALRAQIQATDISLGNPAAGYHKVAFAYQQSGVSGTLFASLDGGAVVSGTTAGTFPSVLNAVFIGKRESSTDDQQWNARIRSAAIYTSRLSNAELIALSTL
jgi:hypothetical protein